MWSVTHLCDIKGNRNRPAEQPTLCGIREPVNWNPTDHTDLSAKGICRDCVEVFKARRSSIQVAVKCSGCTAKGWSVPGSEPPRYTCIQCTEKKLRKESMQHIIARSNDTVALCGVNRDQIVQSGSEICPECSAMDKLIQESIRLIRDPTHGAQMKRLVNAFSELPKTPEEAKKYLEDHPLMKPLTSKEVKAINEALAKSQNLLTAKGATKAMDYKSTAVKALKRGASAGVMKVLSKKIKAKLTTKFPMLAMVPPQLWDVLLCLAINATASSMPDMPGIKAAEALSSEAFEGLLTDATSKMVQDVMETVSEVVMEIAEKKPGLLGCEEE